MSKQQQSAQQRLQQAEEEYAFCQRMHLRYRITERLANAYREVQEARAALAAIPA